MSYRADFCGFLEEKIDEDSDEEYDDIDEKVDQIEIDGESEMIEKDEQILTINTKLWASMFDFVINPCIDHVEKLINEHKERQFEYLCLVGGLSCSLYFQHKMEKAFGGKTKYDLKIVTTKRPILSVVTGAAYFAKYPKYIRQRELL